MKKFLSIFTFILTGLAVTAQTDYTTRITNPSFENDWTGWTYTGMQTQSNTSFSLKSGNVYVEKWVGSGSAVGSGIVSQVLTDLPPGNYELTAAAQNIQQNSATAAQTGAWIFAGDNKTTVTVTNTYKVAFNYVSGSITIGFEAVNASGNWICIDNFKLTLVGDDLSVELANAIESAVTTYGDGTGKEAEQLMEAINAARSVADNSSATGEEQADAILAVQQAEKVYLRANASEDNPLDLTEEIVNPSFETGDFTGWNMSNMQTQSNTSFSLKQGNVYVEKWVSAGSLVGNGSVTQTLTDMLPGRYRLMAAAQNIQQNSSSAAQTGACIFANTHEQTVTTRKQYTLDFVLISNQLEIGFKAEDATGNWLAVDNFRLQYLSDSFDEVKAEYLSLIAKAEELAAKKTNSLAHDNLQAAIDAAKALQDQTTVEGWPEAARTLESAYAVAASSEAIFSRLSTAIEEAQILADSSEGEKDAFLQAIAVAQNIYDSETTTDDQAEGAIDALAQATFAFRILNGTGTAPVVTTDSRHITGCQWAFGRSTVRGSNILESGFCWSEDPDPKVTDNRTTEYINQQGKIYWLRDLKPATIYYIRAYAINKTYAVGYGDVIKIATLPKGTISHWYNNGGDEATNDRINYAIDTAIDYYWNNLTSIHDFGISVTYSPGTPTADCSYGGSMRVGATSSYQQPGTIMHETLHGIGVGTHNMWWNGEMRSNGDRGDWLGDRVTEAVRFWDNNTTGVITGDNTHLWPYGCNGANEDTHNDNLYCMMGIIAQALNEDGLPGSTNIGYALPYYSFNHEDDVKYYIKNEDESRGLKDSYLVENDSHQLVWKTMSIGEATTDDHAAWYLTFTPNNQYYQLRNAATGYYMTYTSSAIKTVSHTTPTTADNFHLMRGRVDVSGHRGYYVIHPESSSTPHLLVANASGKTGVGTFNIAKSATTQRWLIMTAEEAQTMESEVVGKLKNELTDLTDAICKLVQTPHTEDVEGADETLLGILDNIDAEGAIATTPTELTNLKSQAREAGMTFLEGVSATDVNNPFDITFVVQNHDLKSDAKTGWTSTTDATYNANGVAEYFETTFNFYQILSNMPSGVYQLRVQAFQRPGESGTVYAQYKEGTSNVTTQIYIGAKTMAVKNICEDSQTKSLHSSDTKLATGVYVPTSMDGAATYFAKGLYDNTLVMEQTASNSNFRIGIRGTKSATAYWTMFDNFRLLFYGKNRTIVGIRSMDNGQLKMDNDIYDLNGRKVTTPKRGLYIVNGKKVVIK